MIFCVNLKIASNGATQDEAGGVRQSGPLESTEPVICNCMGSSECNNYSNTSNQKQYILMIIY